MLARADELGEFLIECLAQLLILLAEREAAVAFDLLTIERRIELRRRLQPWLAVDQVLDGQRGQADGIYSPAFSASGAFAKLRYRGARSAGMPVTRA